MICGIERSVCRTFFGMHAFKRGTVSMSDASTQQIMLYGVKHSETLTIFLGIPDTSQGRDDLSHVLKTACGSWWHMYNLYCVGAESISKKTIWVDSYINYVVISQMMKDSSCTPCALLNILCRRDCAGYSIFCFKSSPILLKAVALYL